nr:cyclin-dependent kinase E-1 [Tanacetum cinerariifolium]
MWAVGCIFAELLTLKPLFQGQEVKATPNPFQLDQLDKIFKVLGHPTVDKWPTLANLPHWQSDQQHIQGHKYDSPGLYSVVHLSPKNPAYDLLSKMLEYDPRKRITAAQALDHEYFRMEPLPGRNALVPPQPGEKIVNYPTRPRMQQQNMAAYNLASQAGMGGTMNNPGNIPMQRGVAAQPHQQQQQQQNQLRRKDGMGMPGYPQQKSRRF